MPPGAALPYAAGSRSVGVDRYVRPEGDGTDEAEVVVLGVARQREHRREQPPGERPCLAAGDEQRAALLGGQEPMLGLGEYPLVSLADARKRRDEARGQLAHGKNPTEEKRTARAEKIAAGRDTFEAVAIEWLAKMQGRWTDHHAADVRRSLIAEAFPAIGSRPVRDLRPPEVVACLQKIEDRGAIEVAHRTAQRRRPARQPTERRCGRWGVRPDGRP